MKLTFSFYALRFKPYPDYNLAVFHRVIFIIFGDKILVLLPQKT